ncbi:hypothetical protein D3C87_2042140 [compost metagenome]
MRPDSERRPVRKRWAFGVLDIPLSSSVVRRETVGVGWEVVASTVDLDVSCTL